MVENVTPDVMNSKLKAISGFSNGGYYNWGAFTKLFGTPEKLVMTPAKLTSAQVLEIQKALDAGNPVMCGIDSRPEDADYDMHFVLLTDYSGENFTIADPWTGTIRPMKDYLYGTKPSFRSTVEQYIIYSLTETPVESAKDWQKEYEELADGLCGLLTLPAGSYDNQKIMTAAQQLKKDFDVSKDVIDSQNKAYEQEKLIWESTKKGLDDQILAVNTDKVNLGKDIERLNGELKTANSGDGWHFIFLGITKLLKRGEAK